MKAIFLHLLRGYFFIGLPINLEIVYITGLD
jgi:hypothetical protein